MGNIARKVEGELSSVIPTLTLKEQSPEGALGTSNKKSLSETTFPAVNLEQRRTSHVSSQESRSWPGGRGNQAVSQTQPERQVSESMEPGVARTHET